MLTAPCPFCMGSHSAEFPEDLDQAVLACRAQASPDRQGTLDGFDWEALERQPPSLESAWFEKAGDRQDA